MRVLHVAPTAFGHDGLFGGGERYPLELARALALVDGVRCERVTFGREARVEEHDGLRIHVLRAVGHLGGLGAPGRTRHAGRRTGSDVGGTRTPAGRRPPRHRHSRIGTGR